MSQYHEDHMRQTINRKRSCIHPDCDCEINCDHISCSPVPHLRIIIRSDAVWFVPMRNSHLLPKVCELTDIRREVISGLWGWSVTGILTLERG